MSAVFAPSTMITSTFAVRLRVRALGLAKVLFGTWLNGAITIICIALVGWLCWHAYVWAWRDAAFSGNSTQCRAAGGACWAFIRAKLAFTIYGVYPFEERWRAAIAMAIFAAMIGISFVPRFWHARLLAMWIVALALAFMLLRGGIAELEIVPMRNWSGMIVTIWLAVLSLAFSYPVGLALALGRTSELTLIRYLSIGWIETVRGVPLISILFVASIVFPLFMPEGLEVDNLVRAQVAFTAFGSAYLAEVFRAGLQAIPAGQYEAASALGLGYWRTMLLIVMPQALKLVIPPQVNTFIAIFKDTTLILVIGVFDFLGAIKAMLSDTDWLGFATEAYVFAAAIYFVICSGMSAYSKYLERELSPEKNR
ncbi:MAG: ral L-amino acid transport system permease protein [Hyphomicrobiales bacterium]|jgi:general L-amino acid transport system permease protein